MLPRSCEPLFFSLSPASWSHDKLIGPVYCSSEHAIRVLVLSAFPSTRMVFMLRRPAQAINANPLEIKMKQLQREGYLKSA
jgi:hypothetical protein